MPEFDEFFFFMFQASVSKDFKVEQVKALNSISW